jgi:hypothetical protein
MLAIAKHGDAIGYTQCLLERVRDEYDGNAGIAQTLQQRKEMTLFLGSQRRRGFIEDDDARFLPHGARYLHHLFLCGAARRHHSERIDIEIERIQKDLRRDIQWPLPIERLLVAQIEILGDRHRRNQTRLLKDHDDAKAQPHKCISSAASPAARRTPSRQNSAATRHFRESRSSTGNSSCRDPKSASLRVGPVRFAMRPV